MDGNTLAATASKPSMNLFERYLTLWVALCIVAGITLGHLMPDLFQAIGAMEVAKVNLPVAEAASREPFEKMIGLNWQKCRVDRVPLVAPDTCYTWEWENK